MSYGTKKKFLFVSGIIGKPHYLLLDEPMNGLDHHSENEMYRLLIEHLDNNGICVIVSHNLTWIDKWREKYSYYPLVLETLGDGWKLTQVVGSLDPTTVDFFPISR